MLTRKQLKLVTGTETMEDTVIKADRLQQHHRGLEVIETAERQAKDLLAEAERRAQEDVGRRVRQAEARFLRQADDILRGWQQERALMEAFVAEQAGQVLSDAMRQLVQDIPDEQRTSALLRQLLRNQSGEGRGVLYCHPEQQPQVADWLNDHAHLGWQLAIDDVLERALVCSSASVQRFGLQAAALAYAQGDKQLWLLMRHAPDEPQALCRTLERLVNQRDAWQDLLLLERRNTALPVTNLHTLAWSQGDWHA